MLFYFNILLFLILVIVRAIRYHNNFFGWKVRKGKLEGYLVNKNKIVNHRYNHTIENNKVAIIDIPCYFHCTKLC